MINLRKHSCKKEVLICGNTGRRANGDGMEGKCALRQHRGGGEKKLFKTPRGIWSLGI